MTLRRETLKALETRRNSVMAERRKSQMQTLGANNEYGVTGMVILLLESIVIMAYYIIIKYI